MEDEIEKREEEVIGILEAFGFCKMTAEKKFILIGDTFGITVIMEDLKYQVITGDDGSRKTEWNMKWLASLIVARMELMPLPKIFHK